MLNLNCKILGEILVCQTAWGVNHLLTMCMLNLNCKILGEILVCHTAWGVNHLLTMCMLNLNFKVLGEILVCHTTGESMICYHVHVEILTLKF